MDQHGVEKQDERLLQCAATIGVTFERMPVDAVPGVVMGRVQTNLHGKVVRDAGATLDEGRGQADHGFRQLQLCPAAEPVFEFPEYGVGTEQEIFSLIPRAN